MPSSIQESNRNWLQRLSADGDERNEAVGELRALLLARLRRAFQGRSGVDEALLEDVAQEALIKALERLDQFQGQARFTTWATTIAIRVVFTELRRRRWQDVSLEQLLATSSAPQRLAEQSQHEEVERQVLIEELYRLIDTVLTDKQRTALLAELKGMPLEEIGRRMGSNRNAIYKLTHDARKRLKQGLENAGYSIADLQTS